MHPNVKYELQELERLITSGEQLQEGSIGKRTRKNEISLEDAVRREIDRIKQTFIHEVFGFGEERHLERYIQYHQRSLIRLMDEAVGMRKSIRKVDSELIQHCYRGLEELLYFIERHFAKYFDQDVKAPEAYLTIIRKDLQENSEKLQELLVKRAADPKITGIMFYALHKIMDGNSGRGITYRKVLYVKELQKELFNLMDSHDKKSDINEELRNIMYYLNYNSIRSFTYHTHYIDLLLGETETRAGMIEKLSYTLKTINQAPVKPGIGYDIQAPSLKSQMSSYIVEEIDHLQRVHQLDNPTGSRSFATLFSAFKVQFEMSVAQIAYLVKIFIEAKLILNQNTAELLRFLSRFLITRRSENISYDSLRSKYYNVESSTKESVKNILVKLARQIDKN